MFTFGVSTLFGFSILLLDFIIHFLLMRVRLLIILLLVFHAIPSLAGEYYTFQRYSNADGLCCNYVHDVVQDKNGFLWIATEYGLSRFDGTQFRNYYLEEHPSLCRNQILYLHTTRSGQLLIGSNNGVLLSYNEKTDSFDNLMPDDFHETYFKSITGFYEDEKDLWVSTTNGMYAYDDQKKKFAQHPAMSDSIMQFFISSVERDKFGHFLCGYYLGVILLDEKGKHLEEYDELLSFGSIVSQIVKLDEQHFLVSSFVDGVWIISIEDDGSIAKPVRHETPFRNVTSVLRDSRGEFWFGTGGQGLWKATFDGKDFVFEKVESVNFEKEELQKIHCVYEDNQGDIWVGTQNMGLLRCSSVKNSGSLHSVDVKFPIVDGTTFAEDEEGNLFVGADGHGVFQMDENFNIKRVYTVNNGLTSNNVLSLKYDKRGFIWVAMWGGNLCRIDLKTQKVEEIPFEEIENFYNTIKVVHPFSDGSVWACVAGDGVYEMDKEGAWKKLVLKTDTGDFSYNDLWTEDICVSPTGVRWIITSRTVWRYENGEKFPVLPDGDKIPMYSPRVMLQGVCDEEGNLYVVSTQGIIRISEDGKEYQDLDFLPKGQYASILKGDNGVFWTAGSNGILSFDPKKKTMERLLIGKESQNRNYYTCRASFRDSKGNIYFGNSEGFVQLNPEQVKHVSDVSYLNFSRLFVKGRLQPVGSDLLPKSLGDIDVLKLGYDENPISIKVDVIDFTDLNNVVLSYRLTNFDKEWNDLGSRRDITFSHIPPGEYVLEVRANRQGVNGNYRHISLPLVVSPPWWQTWWFRLIMGGIALLAIIIFFRLRFRSILKQKTMLEEKVEERTKELYVANQELEKKKEQLELQNDELEQALNEKDRLISVIAHDLKNPMFAIVCALENLQNRGNAMEESVRKSVKGIYLSAFKLQGVMVKLLEWARGRQQEIKRNIEEKSLKNLAKDVLEYHLNMFEEKNISIRVDDGNLAHYAIMDSRMVATAIGNLLTNAVKFTPENGAVEILFSETENEAIVKVRDHGVGMPLETKQKLLNGETVESRYGTNNEKGTGFGFQLTQDCIKKSGGRLTIESEEGKGTTVALILPKSEILDDFEEEKISVEEQECGKEQCEATRLASDESGKEPEEESGGVVSPPLSGTLAEDIELVKGNTILIVDDEEMLLTYLREVLEPYFNVVEAHNGKEGYQKILQCMPDLIISDIEMPECSGPEMLERIKANEDIRHIPLLFLSARIEESDRLLGLGRGAIDYVNKPFKKEELVLKLLNILKFRRRQQQQVWKAFQEGGTMEKEKEEIDPLLKAIMQIVAEKYCDPNFSAEDMASSLSMSKSTFARKLKLITEKTPTEILTEYRLGVARTLLSSSNHTVSEVAYAVGFNDPYYFSKKFRNFYGYSPSQQNGFGLK